MTRSFQRNFLRIIILSVGITATFKVLAQQGVVVPDDDSSVIYDASFFAEFSPVNVNDMINLIPGVNIAMDYRGGSNNRRGLGPGENEILINGQRQTGKNNEGRSQLSAFPPIRWNISKSFVAHPKKWMSAAEARWSMSCCLTANRAQASLSRLSWNVTKMALSNLVPSFPGLARTVD